MRIRTNSKLYRWTYLLSGKGYGPTQISLCRFFWRCFVWMPLFWIGIATVIGAVIYASYKTKGAVPLAVVLIVLFAMFMDTVFPKVVRGVRETYEDLVNDNQVVGTFIGGVKAIKSKICPIIRFED